MLHRDPLEKVRARTQQGLVLLTDITPTVSIFGSAYITRQHISHPPDRRARNSAWAESLPPLQFYTAFIRSILYFLHYGRTRRQGSITRAMIRLYPISVRCRTVRRSCGRCRIRTLRATASPGRDGGRGALPAGCSFLRGSRGRCRHRRTPVRRTCVPFRADADRAADAGRSAEKSCRHRCGDRQADPSAGRTARIPQIRLFPVLQGG